MTRAEHLKWAKDRAIAEYDFSKKATDAVASLVSDLGKHDETRGSAATIGQLGLMLVMSGKLNTRQEVVNFVSGTN